MGNSNSSAKARKIITEILDNEVNVETVKHDGSDAVPSNDSSDVPRSGSKEASTSRHNPASASLAENLDSLLDLSISDEELSVLLPVSTIRKLRHYRTEVFALLLYTCIKDVHKMALLRPNINGVASSFLPQSRGKNSVSASKRNLSAGEISRFSTALLLLRRCMPVALEPECMTEESLLKEATTSSTDSTPLAPQDASSTGDRHQEKTISTKKFCHSFFSEGSKCNDHNLEDRFPSLCINPSLPEETFTSPSTALVWSLVECCFIRGLTLPLQWKPSFSESDFVKEQIADDDSDVQVSPITFPSWTHNEVDLNLLWYEGVGSENPLKSRSKKTAAAEKFVHRMRGEVLHTLLTTLSSPLFQGVNCRTDEVNYTPCRQGEEASGLQNEVNTKSEYINESPSASTPSSQRVPENVESALRRNKSSSDKINFSSLLPRTSFRDPLFLEPLLSVLIVPLMPTLALSILNALLDYRPFGVMPYSSYLVAHEEKEILMGTRVLVAVLLHEGIPIIWKKRSERPTLLFSSPPQQEDRSIDEQRENETLTSVQTPEESSGQLFCTQRAPSQELERTDLRRNSDLPENMSFHADPARKTKEDSTQVPLSTGGSKITQKKGEGKCPIPSSTVCDGPANPPLPNFVHCVRKLIFEITMRESKLIISNFRRIIGLRTYAGQTYLPDSQKKMESQDEFFFLLWKLIDISPTIYQQFAFHPDGLSYIVPILEYSFDARKNMLDFGHHFQLGAFLLLRLSELRGFCLQCNKVIHETLPFSFPRLSPGSTTYLEVLVIALSIFLEFKHQGVLPVLSSCSFALANITPYLTSIGAATATRLVYTFGVVCTRWLRLPLHSLVRDKYELIMINMCEAIASILQYNGGAGTKCLIAALIPYRMLIFVIVEVFVRQRRHQLCNSNPTPFHILTLDAALTAAAPLVAGAPTASLLSKPAPLLSSSGNTSMSSSPSNASSETTMIKDLMARYMTPTSGIHASSPEELSLPHQCHPSESINEGTVNPSDSAAHLSQESENVTSSDSAENNLSSKNASNGKNDSSSSVVGVSGVTHADIRQTEELFQQLSQLNLVGALPTPHPICVKRLKSSVAVEEWLLMTFWRGLYSCFPDGSFVSHLTEKVIQLENK